MSLEREVRGAGPLVVAAGIAVVAAVASVVQRGIPEPGLALAFGVFIALGELLRISLPNGRQAAPLATAGTPHPWRSVCTVCTTEFEPVR